MDPHHKHIIQINLTILSDNTTNFDELVTELIKHRVLTISDKETLETERTTKKKFSELYLKLLRKGENAYQCLLESLKETQNEFALKLLSPESESPPKNVHVFISYRRDSTLERAQVIVDYLKSKSCPYFFDYDSLSSGEFGKQILANIRRSTHFLLLLHKKDDLINCSNEEDWIRKEVGAAMENQNCKIIPIVSPGFDWPDELESWKEMKDLPKFQQIEWGPEKSAALDKITKFIYCNDEHKSVS